MKPKVQLVIHRDSWGEVTGASIRLIAPNGERIEKEIDNFHCGTKKWEWIKENLHRTTAKHFILAVMRQEGWMK